jgi:hypothetical protein
LAISKSLGAWKLAATVWPMLISRLMTMPSMGERIVA